MAMPYASLSPAGAADHRSSTPTASLLPFCRSTPFSAGGGGGGGMGEDAPVSARWPAARPAVVPFTPAQYEELEQQALIYKYLVAGVPVPPDLVVPIRRGLDSLATRFYGHTTLVGYGPYIGFGKKLDPEPGRCRRTDGKKWRCSKEAAPDSKYCERHMHRGRNRSRKPVETQLVPQPQPPAATAAVTAALPLTAVAANGSSFQNHSLYPAIAAGSAGGGGGGASNISTPFSSSMGSSQLHMDNAAASYAALGGGTTKDLRYNAYGIRSLAEEHNQLISEAIDSSMENQWRLPPSQTSPFPLSSYPQLGALGDLGQNTVSSLSKMERQPLSFPGNSDFGGAMDDSTAKQQENQTLRPFFDEWPKARDSWPGLSDENAGGLACSFPATQLSMSMASSDFSVASSQSPNDD